MSLDALVTYISELCGQRAVSLYTIARKNKWPEEAVTGLLHARASPTAEMLEDLARELDVSVEDLQECLDFCETD